MRYFGFRNYLNNNQLHIFNTWENRKLDVCGFLGLSVMWSQSAYMFPAKTDFYGIPIRDTMTENHDDRVR